MSIRCQSWVYEHSEATGNDRLVLLAIADEADDDGTNAYPGIDRIAHKARVPKRTTMRCIERLEESGRLVVHRPEVKGRGRYNTYVVVMAEATLPPMEGPTTLTPQARQAFLESLTEKVCSYCEQPGDETTGPDGQAWHVDRRRSGQHGGTYVTENMALSCGTCNRRKKGADVAPISESPEKARNGDRKARKGAPPYLIGDRPIDPLTQDPEVKDSSSDVAFETFWKIYPRNADKGGARKAWDKATKKATIGAVTAGAQRFAADPNLPEPQFIPHPTTWLNGERWNDGPLPPRSKPSGTQRPGPSRLSPQDNAAMRAQDDDPNFDPDDF